MTCAFCKSALQCLILSLGEQPLSNAFVSETQRTFEERRYPLSLYVCEKCFLAHTNPVATSKEFFEEYAYFSSYSTTWLDHSKRFAGTITRRLDLDADSFVIEIASNDGYLLQYFAELYIPCLGIEPAHNVAEAAMAKGIPTEVAYWSAATAERLAADKGRADLIVANNVLAHVPDINDFVTGLRIALKPSGVITVEFPHLYRLIEGCEFDTIYHEHFSYFSLFVAQHIFAAHGLTVYDVEELPTHGGSLRVYARHENDASKPITRAVTDLISRELDAGMRKLPYYHDFARRVEQIRGDFLAFLNRSLKEGRRIAAYGAPAKGNVFLNYCGVTANQIRFTVDRNPYKQGLYLPGTLIPIYAPEKVREERPDYLLLLPWNLQEEIMEQMRFIHEWGGKFVVAIPELEVIGPGQGAGQAQDTASTRTDQTGHRA